VFHTISCSFQEMNEFDDDQWPDGLPHAPRIQPVANATVPNVEFFELGGTGDIFAEMPASSKENTVLQVRSGVFPRLSLY